MSETKIENSDLQIFLPDFTIYSGDREAIVWCGRWRVLMHNLEGCTTHAAEKKIFGGVSEGCRCCRFPPPTPWISFARTIVVVLVVVWCLKNGALLQSKDSRQHASTRVFVSTAKPFSSSCIESEVRSRKTAWGNVVLSENAEGNVALSENDWPPSGRFVLKSHTTWPTSYGWDRNEKWWNFTKLLFPDCFIVAGCTGHIR